MGVELAPDEVAYRCNLVTLGADGTMVDFAAGHLSSEQSHPIVAALDAELGDGRDGVRFHAGRRVPPPRGRRRATGPTPSACRPTTSPGSRRSGRPVPRRRSSPRSWRRRSRSSRTAAAKVDSIATQIWLWGQGVRPTLPPFARAVRCRRSAHVRGRPRARARCARRHRGARRARRERRASRTTTARSATRASTSLAGPRLLPAPRRGDRRGRPPAERGGEGRGARVVGPRDHRPAASTRCPTSATHRMLLLPDHATPIRLGTHTSDPVPYLLFDSERRGRRAAVHRGRRPPGSRRSRPTASWPA